MSDLTRTIVSSNKAVQQRSSDHPNEEVLSNLFSKMFVNKKAEMFDPGAAVQDSDDDYSDSITTSVKSDRRTARDRFLSSRNTSFAYDQSVDEDDDFFANYSSPSDARGRHYQNNIESMLKSVLEETVLSKMGNTMGSMEDR